MILQPDMQGVHNGSTSFLADPSPVLGGVFALAYVLTHSLWWVMAAHALVDLWGGTLGWRVMRMPEPDVALEPRQPGPSPEAELERERAGRGS